MGVDVNSYLIYGFRVPGTDIVNPNMNNQEFVEGYLSYLDADEKDIDSIRNCWYDYLIDYDLTVQENGYADLIEANNTELNLNDKDTVELTNEEVNEILQKFTIKP